MIKKHIIIAFFILLFVLSLKAQNRITNGLFRITYPTSDSSIVQKINESISSDLYRVESFFQYSLTDTIDILILEEKQYRQFSTNMHIPDWGIAVAIPANNRMILQSGIYRSKGLPVTLREIFLHELSHILLYQKTATTAGRIPVWFNEGCALRVSGENRNQDMLHRAVLTRSLIPFDELETVLRYDPYKAELAYDQSYSAVGYLIERFGKNIIHTLLNRMNAETDFPSAFETITGISVYRFEKEWSENFYPVAAVEWARYAETIIWFAVIPLLFIFALFAKKNFERRKKKEWENEDEQSKPEDSSWRLHQSEDGFEDR